MMVSSDATTLIGVVPKVLPIFRTFRTLTTCPCVQVAGNFGASTLLLSSSTGEVSGALL